MGDFTKRDVLTIIIGMIVAGVLTVWGHRDRDQLLCAAQS
jgi:hypothetical protein